MIPSPILKGLSKENLLPLDLSESSPHLEHIDIHNTQQFTDYLFNRVLRGKIGIGGYLEKRGLYQRSEHFRAAEEDFRNIHLGVDLWTAAHTPVFSPLDAKVHSFAYNEGFANYGGTIILEHELNGQPLYSLYGHLSKKSLEHISGFEELKAAQLVGWLGEQHENGSWPPHLHFQLMYNIGNWEGDYPGVCAENEKETYSKNCPNPSLLLGI